jgi:hypothetical protein
MTEINFTFTGPMTIHIHVYPGAEPPVITAPELPAPEPPVITTPEVPAPEPPLPWHEPLAPEMPAPEWAGPIGDIQHICLVCGTPISAYDAGRCARHSQRNPVPTPEAPAVGGPPSVVSVGPRGGIRKTCPICGKPISKKANACPHHRGVVARLLAANTPMAAWPTEQPASPPPAVAPADPLPVSDPPAADPAPPDAPATLPEAPVTADPDVRPARESKIPAFLRKHLPIARPGDRATAAEAEAYTELDLTELHGSRIA